jgi:hypothetical protein
LRRQAYDTDMNGRKFTNARVHEWLTPDLDAVARAMRSTRVQLNSAALWWFCRRLSAAERAEVLGEFVKVQALGGAAPSPGEPSPPDGDGKPARSRRSGPASP